MCHSTGCACLVPKPTLQRRAGAGRGADIERSMQVAGHACPSTKESGQGCNKHQHAYVMDS